MKLAVFASHLRAPDIAGADYPAALAWARQLGIEAVEADSGEFKDISPDEYKKMLADAGMRMIAVHHICRLSAPEKELYEQEIQRCIMAAEQVKSSGSEFFMLVPAAVQDIPDIEAKIAAQERIIKGLQRVAEAAVPMGLTLTVENFSKVLFPFSTAAELVSIAERVPSLKLTLDSGNFRCIAADVISAYELIKNRIAFCHVKDWSVACEGLRASDGVYLRGCRLGSGLIPTGELMFRLKHDRFGGWLVIEQESAPGESMSGLIENAVRVLKPFV